MHVHLPDKHQLQSFQSFPKLSSHILAATNKAANLTQLLQTLRKTISYVLRTKDTHYLPIARTQIAQGHNIIALINNEHRERAYHIETCNHQDEGKKQVRNKLFYLHYTIGICLLLVTVLYQEIIT